MRLKSLYIKGFKSFANETVLHFNDDVIGVVGPNGSGKSNIVDAIRWVLGEQKSRELRLEAMTDVIFNGTKTRKEAPSAVVELTFDNDRAVIGSEYNTVSISRTLYRSGESEYRLNGVVCRLKDITGLFMDTGIGSNSYAIIALGMVDDILADKDNARRKMFEQAAGISKYKKRKRETLLKLKSTSADLDRINDLLFEIEGNMKALEKQAKRTKKYFEIKDDYKQLSMNLAARSITKLKDQYKTLEGNVSQATDSYQNLQKEIDLKEAALQREKKLHLDKEILLSQKQKELNQLVSDLRSTENEKDLTQQRIEFNSKALTSLEQSISASEEEVIHIKAELEALKVRIDTEQKKEIILEEDVEVLQSQLASARAKQGEAKQLEDSKNAQIKALQQQIYDAEKVIAVSGNTIETLRLENSRIDQQKLDLQDKLSECKLDLKKTANEIAKSEGELQAAKDRAENRKRKIEQMEATRDQSQEEINKMNRVIDSRQNEYDLLKSMVESFEGFPESIKYLAANWKKDVPILSDLLDVQDAYKSIVEQYLEPYLNYYVVQDMQGAKEAIRLLKGAQKR
jgi:chromosome segregation protein